MKLYTPAQIMDGEPIGNLDFSMENLGYMMRLKLYPNTQLYILYTYYRDVMAHGKAMNAISDRRVKELNNCILIIGNEIASRN